MNKAIAVAILLATTTCGVQLDNENDVAMSDSLRAQVEAQCGDDALILKADEPGIDAVCCVTYIGIIPQVHCITGGGSKLLNPSRSRLQAAH